MVDWTIHQGDAQTVLASLPAASVHTCITSPPYFALRDYGIEGQIGLEDTPALYLDRLVAVFREVKRVLHPSGTLWINMGDSYSGGGGYSPDAPSNVARGGGLNSTAKTFESRKRRAAIGLKPKNLLGMPWHLAFRLQDEGFILRSEIIWHKPSCMPESVRDRPTRAHEHLFLFAKQPTYFYDQEAVREDYVMSSWTAEQEMSGQLARGQQGIRSGAKGARTAAGAADGAARGATSFERGGYTHAGRNRRTVWTINPEPFTSTKVGGGYLPAWEGGDHYAAFPCKLVEPCVLAGSSQAGCCPTCLAPWERVTERTSNWQTRRAAGAWAGNVGVSATYQNGVHGAGMSHDLGGGAVTTTGWRQSCTCPPAPPVPCTVLDCFSGTATTGVVATRLGRRYIGIELSPAYAELSRRRIMADAPLFNTAHAEAGR